MERRIKISDMREVGKNGMETQLPLLLNPHKIKTADYPLLKSDKMVATDDSQ